MNYNKRFFYLIAFILFIFACSKVPRKYIQLNDMKVIIWELMFADKKVTGGTNATGFTDSLGIEYSKVLAYHGISQKKFVESLKFYQSNPEVQKILYDSINNYGSRMQLQLQEQMRKRDSLKLSRSTDSLPSQKAGSLKADTSSLKDTIRRSSDSLLKNKKLLPSVSPV